MELTVPDEAVEAHARSIYDRLQVSTPWSDATERARQRCRRMARSDLAALAPLIVGANQPEPAHEVQCPNCDATIRARMADQTRA